MYFSAGCSGQSWRQNDDIRALWGEERDHWLLPRSCWVEPFSVQMSKTQKCLAHLSDWVSPDPRLSRLRPPRRPLSSPSCPEFVAPWFPPHSVHASREGRRGWCRVLGGSPPSALTKAVLILPAVVSGPNPSSILPSQPVPLYPFLQHAQSLLTTTSEAGPHLGTFLLASWLQPWKQGKG